MQTQIERLTADNAALLGALRRQGCAKNNLLCSVKRPCSDCQARKDAISQPHPGAKLLEELTALREFESAAENLFDAAQQELDEVDCSCDDADPESRCTPCWLKSVIDVMTERRATLKTIRTQEAPNAPTK